MKNLVPLLTYKMSMQCTVNGRDLQVPFGGIYYNY